MIGMSSDPKKRRKEDISEEEKQSELRAANLI